MSLATPEYIHVMYVEVLIFLLLCVTRADRRGVPLTNSNISSAFEV